MGYDDPFHSCKTTTPGVIPGLILSTVLFLIFLLMVLPELTRRYALKKRQKAKQDQAKTSLKDQTESRNLKSPDTSSLGVSGSASVLSQSVGDESMSGADIEGSVIDPSTADDASSASHFDVSTTNVQNPLEDSSGVAGDMVDASEYSNPANMSISAVEEPSGSVHYNEAQQKDA